MTPPDTSPVTQELLRGNQKDSKTTSPYPSRVRNLLGLPNIGAVPLLSTMSLPMVDLPYINSQIGIASSAPQLWGSSQWAESEFDALDNEDGGNLEPLLTNSNQQPPSSEFSELPQKISNNIPGLRPPHPSNSLSSSLSNDSSLEEERNLTNPPTKSELKTTVSSEESFSTVLAGNSTAENHYLANPSSEKATETEIGVRPEGEPTEGTGRQTVLNLSNSQSKVKSRPQAESISPVLTPQTNFIPESMTKKPMASLPLPLSETLPVGEVARSEYQKVNSSMITQIKKLERTVADLSAQVAAQKDFQQPVIPQYPQPNQPQVIVQRSTSQSKAPQAFWERSYMNRLYRWLRR